MRVGIAVRSVGVILVLMVVEVIWVPGRGVRRESVFAAEMRRLLAV